MPENTAAEEFVTADDPVITTPPTLTDEKNLQKATQIERADEELVAPSIRDVQGSLGILKNLSVFSQKRDDQMQDLFNKFETLKTRDKLGKCKQVKITSCFLKEK